MTVAVLSRSLDYSVIGTGELSRENVTDAQWPLCKSEQDPGDLSLSYVSGRV